MKRGAALNPSARDRRTALQWLAFAGTAALAGCGGGDDASPVAGDGAAGGGTATGSTERQTVLDGVREALRAVSGGRLGFDPAAMVQRLRGLEGLRQAGAAANGRDVWARFADGRALVLPNGLAPSTATAGAAGPRMAVAAAGVDRARPLDASGDALPALLTAGQFRLLDLLGPVPVGSSPQASHLSADFVSAETLPALRRMAVGRGFVLPPEQTSAPPDRGFDNGIEGLKAVAGDGFFLVHAVAAAVGEAADATTAICTATPADAAAEARYAAELAAGEFVYAVTWRGVDGDWVDQACLAITPAFAARYWRFPTESFGVLNLAGGHALSDWVDALRGAGLGNVALWTGAVGWERLLAFADDLVQMSLATNRLGSAASDLAPPKLRAYGLGETVLLLQKRGLLDAADGTSGLTLLAEVDTSLYVDTMLPTITYASIDEQARTIELVGQFGRLRGSPAELRVAVREGGGFDEPLLSQAADPPLPAGDAVPVVAVDDQLSGALRPDQLARGGLLQLFNDGRCSNVVQVTHWEIPLRIEARVDDLSLTLGVSLRMRADVRPWRLAADAEPRDGSPLGALGTTLDSSATFAAAGEISETVGRDTTTVRWSGSGGVDNRDGVMRVDAGGSLRWDGRRLSLGVAVSTDSPYQERTTVVRDDPELGLVTLRDGSVDKAVGFGTTTLLELVFDDRWNLAAGQVDLPPEPVSLLGDRQRRVRVGWPAVQADFPPRDDFGGT